LLISGAVNEIQVRDTTQFNELLKGQAKHLKEAAEIKTLTLMKVPTLPNPIVVAGDSLGYITLLSINAANQPESVTFGAHCDDQKLKPPVIKVFVFNSPGAAMPILISLDNIGRFRLWTN
jgi:hypothetical protein